MSSKRPLEDATAAEPRKAAVAAIRSLNMVVYHAVNLTKESYLAMLDRIKGKLRFDEPKPGCKAEQLYTEAGDIVGTESWDEMYIYRYREGHRFHAMVGLCILSVTADDNNTATELADSIKKWYRNLRYDDDWSGPIKKLLDETYATMLGEEAGIDHEHCDTITVLERDGCDVVAACETPAPTDSLPPGKLNIVAYFAANISFDQYERLRLRCAGVYDYDEPEPDGKGELIRRTADQSVFCSPEGDEVPEYPLAIHRYADGDKDKYALLGLRVASCSATEPLLFVNKMYAFNEAQNDDESWITTRRAFLDDVMWDMAELSDDWCELISVYERK
jgi:hypothetical protein